MTATVYNTDGTVYRTIRTVKVTTRIQRLTTTDGETKTAVEIVVYGGGHGYAFDPYRYRVEVTEE